MAATLLGTELSERHRVEQLAVRARALQGLTAVWPMFNPASIDESWPPLQAALMAMIAEGRTESAAVASTYYGAFRAAEGIDGAFEIPALGPSWRQGADVSLRVTGPVRAKQLTALHRLDISEQTFVSVAGAMGRWVLEAGRATVIGATGTERMRRRVGWARTTSAEPCAFCAMLASRGPVYSADTATFRAHDNCACGAEPIFSYDQPWPGRAQEWKRLYNEATSGVEGDLFEAFRRAYEGRAA